jgi:lipid A 3-O-deacylase
MDIRHCARALAGLSIACSAAVAQASPDAWFVEGAGADRGTLALTAGLKWQWAWKRALGPLAASASTELFVSHWFHRDEFRQRSGTTLVGVVPLLRLRFDEGRSPWFVEGGIGLTLADRRYLTVEKEFSTRANFYDVLAAGYAFGRHELSLRVTHISNGSVKRPNPGENFLQLRWGMQF